MRTQPTVNVAEVAPCPNGHALWMNCTCLTPIVEEEAEQIKNAFLERTAEEKIRSVEARTARINRSMDDLEVHLRTLLEKAGHSEGCLVGVQHTFGFKPTGSTNPCTCGLDERKQNVRKGFDILREEVNS